MWPSLVIPGTTLVVSTYTIVRTSYVVLALCLTLVVERWQGIPNRFTLRAFAIGVPLGILATRVLDGLEYWDRYRSLTGILTSAGSSIYGAFIVVIPFVWLYARRHGVSPLRFLDGGAPAMALGEAMTRIGCFLNGCCYGVPPTGGWAVTFPPASFAYREQVAQGLLPAGSPHTLPVHPVQLYSFAIMTVVFLWLLRILRRPHPDGEALLTFLLAYGLLRLAMAPLRAEALASMQLFSVIFVVVGGLGLWAIRSAPRRVPVRP
jgi:phosphatidylglycerol---prolipoprotein diacylglyceryl transferase